MHKVFKISILSTILIAQIFSGQFNIIEKRISYTLEREKLSIQYLKERHGIIQNDAHIVPKMIVLHYTDGGNVESLFNYFNNTTIEKSRTLNKKQSRLNVSAHYLVDRDGTIYHLVDDTLFARHVIGLNYCAIGVENIGNKSQPLTKAQEEANAFLIRTLVKKYPITHVIGHSEYKDFRNTAWWKETNSSYFTFKQDPGTEFLMNVRSKIKDLNLKYTP